LSPGGPHGPGTRAFGGGRVRLQDFPLEGRPEEIHRRTLEYAAEALLTLAERLRRPLSLSDIPNNPGDRDNLSFTISDRGEGNGDIDGRAVFLYPDRFKGGDMLPPLDSFVRLRKRGLAVGRDEGVN